jgi:hypothetical protein
MESRLTTDWTTGRSGFDHRQRQGNFFPSASASRPALGPTHPPVQWVAAGPFPGAKVRPGRDADHSPHLVQGQEWVGAILPLPQSASMACSGTALAIWKPTFVVEWLAFLLHIRKARSGDRLSWLRYSWLSSAPPGKYRDSILNYTTTASFHILSNSSFTYHHFIWRYYNLSNWKSVVKITTINTITLRKFRLLTGLFINNNTRKGSCFVWQI